MKTVSALEEFMTRPSTELIEDMKRIDGDILILGVGGKMGPTLAILAKRAIDEANLDKKVIGVSRFSNEEEREKLEKAGIETIAVDLLDEEALSSLPDVKNVIFMVGHKFGTKGNEHFTWLMNTYLPGRVANKYRTSRIVAFSSGNIYPLTDIVKGNCSEDTSTDPIGEYAQSCLGRERILTSFSHKHGTEMLLFRLNYAIDLRYGVLLEIAHHVFGDIPFDLSMGKVNVIWQGDANEYALRSLRHCASPPTILNVTGPETLSVRWLAQEFGKRFNKEPKFISEEQPTALLNNASRAHQLFGYPKVTIQEMIDLTANWVENDGEVSGKPTHFQEREGDF